MEAWPSSGGEHPPTTTAATAAERGMRRAESGATMPPAVLAFEVMYVYTKIMCMCLVRVGVCLRVYVYMCMHVYVMPLHMPWCTCTVHAPYIHVDFDMHEAVECTTIDTIPCEQCIVSMVQLCTCSLIALHQQ